MAKLIDLTSNKYGKLTVTGVSHRKGRYTFWAVKCECGTEKVVSGENLKSGSTRSCGCNAHLWRKDSKVAIKDMAGKKFGRLIVISFNGKKDTKAYWGCECECGKKVTIHGSLLRKGSTKSCGCLQIDTATKHGLSYHPLYRTWYMMVSRCHDKSNKAYKWYGEIGISVCDEWRESLSTFIKDMGSRPKGMSLDRINGTKSYSKDNCKWSSDSEQQNNRRNNTWFEYNGKTYNRKQLCDILGIKYATVAKRLSRGKSMSEALGCDIKQIEYSKAMKIKLEINNGSTQ